MADKRSTILAGQWIAHPAQLVNSPAMRVISKAAGNALRRIEAEHMSHGGAENGRLPVTFADFELWGIPADLIAPALRELEALGLIERTRKGYGGPEGERAPSHYRLTYLRAVDAARADGTGTHCYMKIKTMKEAKAKAAAARKATNPLIVERSRRNFFTPRNPSVSPPESGGEAVDSSPPESGGTCSPPESGGTIYISGRSSDLGHGDQLAA